MSEAKAPILITGATGIVGSSILFMLQERMRDVPIRLMVRDVNKAKSSLPENVEYVAGDVTDKQSVSAAVAGCQGVFHAAGMPEQWVPDQSVFDKVNAEGTRIVMDACIEHNVPRVVFTSTMDALEWQDGKPYDESQLAVRPLLSAYQNSKLKATKIVLEYVEKGLQIATIHPSAVYGPGRASAPTMNDVLDKLMKNEMPLILPGGITMVFAEDVAYCHIRAYELLAAGKIPSGTRYLVSGPYQTLAEIAAEVHKNNPPSKVPKELPVFVAKVVAHTGSFFSHFTGKPPLIAPTQLENVLAQGRPVTTKAETELEWKPTPFAEGMQRTIEWLRGIQAVQSLHLHQAQ